MWRISSGGSPSCFCITVESNLPPRGSRQVRYRDCPRVTSRDRACPPVTEACPVTTHGRTRRRDILPGCASCRPSYLATLASISCSTSSARSAVASPAAPITTPTTTRDVDLRQRWLEMFARGYFPGRSGQIFVVPREGEVITDRDPLYRFMHGSPWDYDTQIPILFYGAPFIRQGCWKDAAAQQDIAPTLGALIGASPLQTYTGRALSNAIAAGPTRPRSRGRDGAGCDARGLLRQICRRHADADSRMRREGAWFSEARAITLPTVTGVGHATIGTGTDPRIHGITVNALFNRVTGQSQQAYDQLDPRELMALTLADAWNLTTDGRAIIIGQGGAIRATAGLVGRGACIVNGRKVIAASYSTRDAGWETNPACYTMSEALAAYNGKAVWQAAGGKWMGHDISDPLKFRASSLFQRFEAEALLAVHGARGHRRLTRSPTS